MELFKLFGSIFVDNEEANKSISKTDEKAEGLGKKLGEGIKTAAKWGAAIGGAAIAAGGAMFGVAKKSMDALDRIDKLSQKIGVSRDAFQTWEYVLSQSGTDIEKMQVGLKTMVQRMDETARGAGQGAAMFGKLGVSVMDSTGKMRDQEDVFNDTVLALTKMPEGAEKSRLAFELFGKAGMELMPLLNSTTDDVETLKDRAHELGLVLSDDAVDAGVKFQDTLDDLKRSFGAVITNVGAELIPIFQSLADWIFEHMPQIQEIVGKVFAFLQSFVSVFIDVLRVLIGTFTSFFDGTKDGAIDFQAFFEMFKEWFERLFETIKEILEAALIAIKEFWDKYGEDIISIAQNVWDIIKTVIDTTLKIIRDVIKVITGIIKGDWSQVWEGIKGIFKSVWEAMKNILPSLLEGIYAVIRGAFKVFLSLGEGAFNAVWDGMKGIWSSISKWVSDKVNWLKDKLAFWKKSNEEMDDDDGSSSTKKVSGSHAGGLAYVPYDGYVAELHKGERVLTAAENKSGSTTINHTGTIKVEGVNNKNELMGIVDIVIDTLRREVRMA